MPAIVVLRPEPGTTATVERITARGWRAIALPLFEVQPVAWDLPDPADYDALLLTSANAVRHAGPNLSALRSLPAHVVGDATARAASAAGLSVAQIGTGFGADLIPAAAAMGVAAALHLCGRATTVLPDLGVVRTRRVVYDAVALAPALDPLPGQVVLVHSSRAGRTLAQLSTAEQRRDTIIVAISPAAAAACSDGWRTVIAADAPGDDAMLDAAGAFLR